jgi:Leucine-rich repeat (LRR) protein
MLTSLPEKIFSGLSVLFKLNLEANLLQDMHPNVFVSTPHLDSLRLGYNTGLGKSIMKSADFLTVVLQRNLTDLALNSMSITSFPNYPFNKASQLRHLSLADNPLKVIEMFPTSLDTLNLSGIEIEVILPGDFKSYPKLKNLYLDRLIHLKSVEENAFEGLMSLDVLTMENCIELHEFDERAFVDPESVAVPLKRLSLSRSGLHTLSSKTLVPLKPTLEHLALDGNPWCCDCKLAWIRQTNFSLEHTEYLRQVHTISDRITNLCTQFRNIYGSVLLLKHCAYSSNKITALLRVTTLKCVKTRYCFRRVSKIADSDC